MQSKPAYSPLKGGKLKRREGREGRKRNNKHEKLKGRKVGDRSEYAE